MTENWRLTYTGTRDQIIKFDWYYIRRQFYSMVGYSVECFSRTIVDVECKYLIGSGSAEHRLPYAALLILLGVRYNRGVRAVHLIGGGGWCHGCQRGRHTGLATWCVIRSAMGVVVSWWSENKKQQMAIECIRMMSKHTRWQRSASELKVRKLKGKLTVGS